MTNERTPITWAALLGLLPHDLSKLPKSTGATSRWRKVCGGEQFLWLCLVYVQALVSMRTMAGFSVGLGADGLKEASVLYRLRKAGPFLAAILLHVLGATIASRKSKGVCRNVRLQDATTLITSGRTEPSFSTLLPKKRPMLSPRAGGPLERSGYALAKKSLRTRVTPCRIRRCAHFPGPGLRLKPTDPGNLPIRWQIELLFKRCKSILNLDKLEAQDPALVHTFCLGKVIEAAVIERLNEQALDLYAASPFDALDNENRPHAAVGVRPCCTENSFAPLCSRPIQYPILLGRVSSTLCANANASACTLPLQSRPSMQN